MVFARLALPSVLAVSLAVSAAQTQKSIIVTVLDSSGAPVKNVEPASLGVSEDGAVREVVSVTPAADPMTVALLVDTTKPTMGKNAPTQEMRAALNTFVKIVQGANPANQIGLWEVAGAAVMTQKPTVKTEDLTKRINRLFPAQQPGGVFLEAFVDASKELNKKGAGPRRVIVSVTLNSPETSTIEPRDVAIEMRKAGVNFWAVSIQGSGDSSTSSGGGTPSRELILDNVTAASGGMRLTAVTAISLEAQLKSIADALISQVVVTYVRPSGGPAPSAIQATSKKGMRALTGPWVQ